MSFIDLATLALHRRNEMEARISIFATKCDQAIQEISKLKMQAETFVQQLNCEPFELKERFLKCMRTVDEYMYLITDFNLAVSKLDETTNIDYPVHDNSTIASLPRSPTYNIIDILSEPTPSTSKACPNMCPLEKFKKNKVPKEEQTLIMFSSSSSSESVPSKNEAIVTKKEQEVQCQLAGAIDKKMTLTALAASPVKVETCNLPAQTILQIDQVYMATIMNIDGTSLWIITEHIDDVIRFMKQVSDYYKKHWHEMAMVDVTSLTYCALYDEETDSYYRALFIRLLEEEPSSAELFLVDTGEVRTCPAARDQLRPLVPAFCARPPFARCCHFAGIELLSSEDQKLTAKLEKFLSQYIGAECCIEVDDNASESLGVYVILSETETLNQLLIEQGLAYSTEVAEAKVMPPAKQGPSSVTYGRSAASYGSASYVPPAATYGPPELANGSELDIMAYPEYEDPVEAVTGYRNRDEAEICKHYKGPPDTTCFKGSRCKKKHIVMHPDGWTLDRVEVTAKCAALPLPAPGTYLRVRVTSVPHFDHLFVQLVDDDEEEELPKFGVIIPPTTLKALVRDMNSPASRMEYKPLTLAPAHGELVAALYPPDGQWYRARVTCTTRADQSVEVQYIDYGNVVWLREDNIRVLDPRYATLPAQAVRVALAGVVARTDDSRQWAAAKKQLTQLTQDKIFDAHVVGRSYDEITVELFDEHGYSVSEQLAALDLVSLQEFAVVDDTDVKRKLVVP